jgi:heme/copper-type cytochrome/quinol oxidase subunit 2
VNADPYAHTATWFVTVGIVVMVVIMTMVVTMMVMVFRRYDDDRATADLIGRRHTGAG